MKNWRNSPKVRDPEEQPHFYRLLQPTPIQTETTPFQKPRNAAGRYFDFCEAWIGPSPCRWEHQLVSVQPIEMGSCAQKAHITARAVSSQGENIIFLFLIISQEGE